MKKQLYFGTRKIEYFLIRKEVRNINLRIKSDKSIYVSANPDVSESDIESFIISKSDTIFKTLSKYDEFNQKKLSPKKFIDGESFFILGHERRLRVFRGKKNIISDDGQFINLTVKQPDDVNAKKRLFEKWQKNLCRQIIFDLCKNIYPKFEKYGIVFPEIRIRKMKSRWGSCHYTKKTLTLNLFLIEFPVSCIEYVITHEFTHFIHPNHSKSFYKLLTAFMPDWAARKKLLAYFPNPLPL